MIKKINIAPERNRIFAADTNIIIPDGQVMRVKGFEAILPTDGTVAELRVDGKPMFWSPGHANFLQVSELWYWRKIFQDLQIEGPKLPFLPIIADEGQVATVIVQAGSVRLRWEMLSSRDVYNRQADGGTEGKKRILLSCARDVFNVGIGATVDHLMATNINPNSASPFPWTIVAPPQRVQRIRAFLYQGVDVCGTNLAFNGIRLLHEGRELITDVGVVTAVDTPPDFWNTSTRVIVFKEPYEVFPFESVQAFMRVTSTDAGIQAATLRCALLLEEEIML